MTRPVLVLLVALVLAVPLSLLAGRVWIDPFHPVVANAAVILAELRLPRAVLALAVGGGLGAAGAAMQGYLRNPLADPGLFGIAPTAALGATLSFLVGGAAGWLLPVFALTGAGLGMALLALISAGAGAGGGDPGRGIALFTLSGMMLASLSSALMALALSLAPTPFALTEIVTWQMGAIADRSWRDVWICAPPTVIGVILLASSGRDLDALTLGETAARSLGVDPRHLQWRMIGLMVPHLVRPFTDRRPSSLIWPSALGGALLLLVADCLCRVLPLAGGELRLGVALALLGTPFFLLLLLRMRGGAA
jgi:iron complex transport system permease protein